MKHKITYPRSEKVYLPGKIYPEIRVGMRKVSQVPTVTEADGERMESENPDIYI